MVCRDFILPEPASYVFFYAVFNLRNLLYIIFSLPIGEGIAAREIIKVPSGKADTGDYFAVFPPLSPQFLERLER